MSREMLEKALIHHDHIESELRVVNIDLQTARSENSRLTAELVEAISKISELETRTRHLETIMSTKIAQAAVEIIQKMADRTLTEIGGEIKEKIKGIMQAPGVRATEAAQKLEVVATKHTTEDVEQAIEQSNSLNEANTAEEIRMEREHSEYAPPVKPRRQALNRNRIRLEDSAAIPKWLNPARYSTPDQSDTGLFSRFKAAIT